MYYEEDRFAPNNIDDDELGFQPQRQRSKVDNFLAETNENDPSFFRIKRKLDGITKPVSFFSAGQRGSTIRNAVTGIICKGHLVGTPYEDLYFKISLATGETGQTPNILFYDSPEQYEKHMMCEVSQKTKERWNEKSLKASKQLIKSDK